MKKLSVQKLSTLVLKKRDELKLTQEQLSTQTGINRITIGRIEREDFIPSIHQLESIAQELDFDPSEMFVETENKRSFIALRSEVVNEYEKEGVDHLFSMMLTLRQHIILRSKYDAV
jgi:transcriptional regulator with XRE-family HTH domain